MVVSIYVGPNTLRAFGWKAAGVGAEPSDIEGYVVTSPQGGTTKNQIGFVAVWYSHSC